MFKVVRFAFENLHTLRTNFWERTADLDPVVQKVDSAIHWINRYPVDMC